MDISIKNINKLDWNFISSDTKYLTHSIHRYSGKYIPQIPNQAIRLTSKVSDIILDPFCGSGTTLLEASLLGRKSIGIDLNPLAVLISKVKTTRIEPRIIKKFFKELQDLLISFEGSINNQSLFIKFDFDDKIKNDLRWDDPWYNKWFQKNVLYELLLIHYLISETKSTSCRNVALVAFSDILRRVSNANSSYPNIMFDKRKKAMKKSVVKIFLYRLQELVTMVENIYSNLKNKPVPKIIEGDAKSIKLKSSVIDAIITHPPYVSSIPYAEYGQLSLKWLGHEANKLDDILMGGKRSSKYVVERFTNDYRIIIKESFRVLKENGYLFMMIGNPISKGEIVDLLEITLDLSMNVGFKKKWIFKRNGINKRAGNMNEEYLIFLQKI